MIVGDGVGDRETDGSAQAGKSQKEDDNMTPRRSFLQEPETLLICMKSS